MTGSNYEEKAGKAAPFLAGKLQPPHLRQVLARPRLLKLAELDQRPRLVTICAGAGYGKTTLMAQLARSSRGKWLWYQTDDLDSDPAIFLRHLITGMSVACDGVGARSLRRLDNETDLKNEGENVIGVLLDEIEEQLTEPMTIFFDDFHIIDGTLVSTVFIDYLIGNFPAGSSVVIASRKKPKLAVSRLRAKRQVREIGEQDLRFSHKELKQLLRTTWKHRLPDDTVDKLYQNTEGWITGLVLLEEHLTSSRDIPSLFTKKKKVRRHIYEYLAEEVLNRHPEIKTLLLKSAFIDPVDAKICKRALGIRNPSSLLNEALRLNLFIAQLGDANLYRLHSLFREFLLLKLNEDFSVNEINDLRHRFGQAFAASGDFKRSVEQFLAGGFYEQAGGSLNEISKEMLNQGEYQTLGRWFSEIGVERMTPVLLICWSELLIAGGKFEQAEKTLRTAKKEIDAFDFENQCRCAIAMSECLCETGRNAEGIQVLEKISKLDLTPELRFEMLFRLSALYFAEFDHGLLERSLLEAQDLIRTHDLINDGHRMNLMLAVQCMRNGNFKNGEKYFISILDSNNLSARNHNITANNLASCQMLKGSYGDALTMAEKCLEIVMGQKQYKCLPLILDTYGCIQVAQGNIEQGVANIQMAIQEEESQENKAPATAAVALCHLGTLARRQGNLEKAINLHSRSLDISRTINDLYSEAMAEVNLGADNVRKKQFDQASENFSKAKTIAEAHGFNYVMTQLFFQSAWSAHMRGEREEEIDFLKQALPQANKNGQNHFLIQEGVITLPLLTIALSNKIETEYVSWLMERIGLASLTAIEPLISHEDLDVRANAAVTLGKIGEPNGISLLRRMLRDQEPYVKKEARNAIGMLREKIQNDDDFITHREMQILKQISTGASNAQIAKNLFISELTVKTHINNIFKKLGMTNRWEAALYFQAIMKKSTTLDDWKNTTKV